MSREWSIGSERHWVCAVGRRSGSGGCSVRSHDTGLVRMGEWLAERKVGAVAMESTGVYWVAPYDVLEARGLQVLLVDTRQLAQVPGRDKKTDPTHCEWIQRLH